MDILDRISELLNGREQRELTDYLGLKSVAFSEWKSGKSKSYRKYLIEIAEFFNVSIDYLVYGKESNFPNESVIINNHGSNLTNNNNVAFGGAKQEISKQTNDESDNNNDVELNSNTKELIKVFESLPTREQIELMHIVYKYEAKYRKANNT